MLPKPTDPQCEQRREESGPKELDKIRDVSPASPCAPVATAQERTPPVQKTNKTNRGLTHFIVNVSRNLPMAKQPWATARKFVPAVADVFRRVSVT